MKKTVAILFGGQSAEHNVSLVSAKCLLEALNTELFTPLLVGISKEGDWYQVNDELLKQTQFNEPIDFRKKGEEVFLSPGKKGARLMEVYGQKNPVNIDFAFPIIHGPLGEDGTLQALFRLLQIPFAGCDVTSSSICMDKDLAKRILQNHGIMVSPFISLKRHQKIQYDIVSKKLGKTLYVKPCNMGSSVGVSRISNKEEFEKSLQVAFLYDDKILIESAVDGIEVEVAVTGNAYPKASLPGSFKTSDNFYSYGAKYLDEGDTQFLIPATGDEGLNNQIQEFALTAYKALGCEGFARVDLFITPKKELLINEINTLPGMTPISMFPKLWQESGISFTNLITDIINLGIERFEAFSKRSTVSPQ